MATLAFGAAARLLDAPPILEGIIASQADGRVNLQFLAARLNRMPDMFQMSKHLFFHYAQGL